MKIHPLTEKLMHIISEIKVVGSSGGSIVEVESSYPNNESKMIAIDKEIRKWLEEKKHLIHQMKNDDPKPYNTLIEILELEPEKKWCKHFLYQSDWTTNSHDIKVTTSGNVPESWKLCPICGVKRPE